MYHLILTACLAGGSGPCAPLLLPQGDAPELQGCQAKAPSIIQHWLANHPDLTSRQYACLANADLPALTLTQIASDTYLHQGQPVPMEQSDAGHIANLGVILGETVIVVDSGTSRAQGQQLYTAIRRLTDRPISHVVLTHMHPDHALGASVFREAGAVIVGSAFLPDALAARGGTYLDILGRLYPAPAVIGTEVVLPDLTVTDTMMLDAGRGHRLTLGAATKAHTDNDLWLRDDATGTLFTGDLVFRTLTPVLDGSLAGWLDWMRTTPQPMPDRIVPGHGPVAATWEEAVAGQRELMQALAQEVRTVLDRGLPLSAAVPAVVQALQPLSGGWTDFDATMARNATTAYKQMEWQ